MYDFLSKHPVKEAVPFSKIRVTFKFLGGLQMNLTYVLGDKTGRANVS